MMTVMRTTVNLDDEVYELAKSVSIQRRISLGDALGELVRGNLTNPLPFDTSQDFPCFPASANAEPITMRHTLEMEDEW